MRPLNNNCNINPMIIIICDFWGRGSINSGSDR